MPAFDKLDWSRFDVFALIVGRGIAAVEQASAHRCEDWLRRHDYRVVTLAFARGIGPVVVQLGEMLAWRRRFGYELTAESRNLMALHDGFIDIDVEANGAVAFVLQDFSRAWQEDESWSLGFLGIVAEHSLRQLALGRRLLAVLVVTNEADPLIDQPIGQLRGPAFFGRVFD